MSARWRWPVIGLLLAGPAGVAAQVRILVINDMEGLAGQDDVRSAFFPYSAQYARGQELLLADVNAVIDGLVAAGARVDVWDHHGGRNPGPNLLADRLRHGVRMAPLTEPLPLDSARARRYDGVVFVGFHGASGSGGFAAHTMYPLVRMWVNGEPTNEIHLMSAERGEVGVPVLMATGDDRLQGELARLMPWVDVVVAKRSTGDGSVELRPVDEVHREMREVARRAVGRRAAARLVRLEAPLRLALEAIAPSSFRLLKGVPGFRYTEVAGGRVEFSAPSLAEAYADLAAVSFVARETYRSDLLAEVVAGRPDADAISIAARDLYFTRWAEVESGRWRPPPKP
jgi:D-amino peptidase